MTQTTALTPVTYELRGAAADPDFVKRVVGFAVNSIEY